VAQGGVLKAVQCCMKPVLIFNKTRPCFCCLLQDYDTYTNVMYLHVAVVGMLLLGMLALGLTVHKVQKSKTLKNWVKVLHVSDGRRLQLQSCLLCPQSRSAGHPIDRQTSIYLVLPGLFSQPNSPGCFVPIVREKVSPFLLGGGQGGALPWVRS